MIPIDNAALYAASLRWLKRFTAGSYEGRLVQIFLAAKYLGDAFPRVGAGDGIDVGDLQHLLDRFYGRNHPQIPDRSIAIIFEDNHLVPTGRTGAGLTVPSNIWRNNFGLQKAIVCYASAAELQNPQFVTQTRTLCPHLVPVVPGSLAKAACALHMESSYRREDGPKLLRRDVDTWGFSIVSPERVDLWQDVLRAGGRRLPVIPLIVALYHDSDLAGGRQALQPADFMRDFNFSRAEYDAYFDDDPASQAHVDLTAQFAGLGWDRIAAGEDQLGAGPGGAQPGLLAGARLPARQPQRQRDLLNPDDLPNEAPQIAPPAGSHWWSAEQAVEEHLRAQGWTVWNRTRNYVGFDLELSRPGQARNWYVEVKSSAGNCAPVLTRSEHEAARRYGNRYILAIVERFVVDQPIRVLWVRNPHRLGLAARQVEEYPVPRALWLPNATPDIEVE